MPKIKKAVNTIDADLSTLKDTIDALDEVLSDPDFDLGEATDYCDQIEELAKAINESLMAK